MSFGPTGEPPEWQSGPAKEGEIVLGVGCDLESRMVLIEFGSPVVWITMSPTQAIEFAAAIVKSVLKCSLTRTRSRGRNVDKGDLN